MATYKQFTGAAPVANLTAQITGSPGTFSASPYSGFPTGAGSVPFVVCIDRNTANEEKILCSSMSAGVFTIQTRGFDGTAQVNHANGATVEHVLDADSLNDMETHIHVTTLDQHGQYARTDGTRAVTGNQTFSSGITVTGGAGVDSLSATGAIQAALSGTGRYIGTTNGAPTSGAHNSGDFANDPTNQCFWLCTATGTPGTWKAVGGPATAAAVAAGTIATGTLSTTLPVYQQSGLLNGTPNGSAQLSVTFPTAFANGVAGVDLTPNSTLAQNYPAFVLASVSLTGFVVTCFTGYPSSGNKNTTLSTTFTWSATGN